MKLPLAWLREFVDVPDGTATGCSRSAITSMVSSSVRRSPSSVTIVSPARARRTRISGPRSRAASNAWSGWPNSSITKFVTSTTLLIGRRPIDSSRFFNHAGLSFTVTPLMRTAV